MSSVTACEAILLNFEKEIETALPFEYRQFLIQTGGETPKKNSFSIGSGGEVWETDVSFFGLQTGAYCLYSVPDNFKEYVGRIPRHLVPIGSDPGGNLICISVAEGTHGQIFFADHDYFTYDDQEPAEDGAQFLSLSFQDFFGSLRERSEGW